MDHIKPSSHKHRRKPKHRQKINSEGRLPDVLTGGGIGSMPPFGGSPNLGWIAFLILVMSDVDIERLVESPVAQGTSGLSFILWLVYKIVQEAKK